MSFPATSEKLIAVSKTNIDTLYSFLTISLESIEKLSSHHLSALREVAQEQLDSTHRLLESKSLSDVSSLQGGFGFPQFEQVAAYQRGIVDISSGTQEHLIKLLERQQAEFNKAISLLLDGYAKSSANSEVAVAAVKSAISAANSAFENANKAARQVANITEAGLSAASSATVRAVSSTSPARKKAA
jgi:phasin family protein